MGTKVCRIASEAETSDDSFEFVQNLIYLSEHYVRFKRATTAPYIDDRLEAIFFNAVNGLNNQPYIILAAVRS
jgi:hypothetical protein